MPGTLSHADTDRRVSVRVVGTSRRTHASGVPAEVVERTEQIAGES